MTKNVIHAMHGHICVSLGTECLQAICPSILPTSLAEPQEACEGDVPHMRRDAEGRLHAQIVPRRNLLAATNCGINDSEWQVRTSDCGMVEM